MSEYRIFLIDYENTGWGGLTGLTDLSADDFVYIFYTGNGGTLPFSAIHSITASKAKIYTKNVVAGTKNALDFQLASELGFVVGEIPKGERQNCEFFVISKDNGYSPLIPYWKERCVDVFLAPTILSAIAQEKRSSKDYLPKMQKCECTDQDLLPLFALGIGVCKSESSKHSVSAEELLVGNLAYSSFIEKLPADARQPFTSLAVDDYGKKFFRRILSIFADAHRHNNKQPNDLHSLLHKNLGSSIAEKQAKKGKIISRIYKMLQPVITGKDADAVVGAINGVKF